MDTGRLRRFATEARKVLMQGVSQNLMRLGFNADGSFREEPTLYEGGAAFMGETVSEDFYRKWISLRHAIETGTYKNVVEEAAYTWFNRLTAAQILSKNGLISNVLEFEAEDIRVPAIVREARQGRLPQMDRETADSLNALLQDDSKTAGQFQMLIVAFCHSTPVINSCFGRITDWTELLLPTDILSEGGFVNMLNHTEFIAEEDWHSPELIGWLYQFYISERKDEVFAKKGKVEADEIPAATQIFTPNWIVKYMVQNTVGRIYLDNNPSEAAEIAPKWQYLVEQSAPTTEDAVYHCDDLTELRLADLACGSGHILNEFFDLLYGLYLHDGYSVTNAVRNIFERNILGIDIDSRAKQLATFALLLKACQKDRSFASAQCMPRIYDMPQPYEDKSELGRVLRKFLQAQDEGAVGELCSAITLMDNADSLGSIMKFSISERVRKTVAERMEEWSKADFVPDEIRGLFPFMNIILALTDRYSALVMNPPYMGSGNMNPILGDYVKNNYTDGKADLCTAFMVMQGERTDANGYYANIIPPSWMFLSSFENLRRSVIDNNVICSLLHLSRGVFGADFGSVSCVVQNRKDIKAKGTYFRLIERTFQEFDQKHLKSLFEKTLENHSFRYYFADYNKEIEDIVYSEYGAKIYYPDISQQNFEKIPGCPIGYWVSEKMRNIFEVNHSLSFYSSPRKGNSTSNNARFLRIWFEVENHKIGIGYKSVESFLSENKRWLPYNKGGGTRKWYGYNEYLVDWKDNAAEIRSIPTSVVTNEQYYMKPGLTWSTVSSTFFGVRYFEEGFIFDNGGCCLFELDERRPYIAAFLNSKVLNSVIEVICPTLNYQSGDISKLPIIYKDSPEIVKISLECKKISKADWDAHETSWDFRKNELLRLNDHNAYMDVMGEYAEYKGKEIDLKPAQVGRLKWVVGVYKTNWETKFHKLHDNEEELNRQFIEIYGLGDELTPEVPMEEVTILQQGEISIADGKIQWHDDVLAKQLLSYAVGCMMGRYSIDRDGLILANAGDGVEEYGRLVPDSRFEVDEDAIIPLMPSDSDFADNATLRFRNWLAIAFGEENLVRNLNYVESCLGKTIDDYFVKDFWNDHKRMYQNRPIYWLFSTKRKAFQCVTYMHRMNASTVERIRSKYLLPHIDWLKNCKTELEANAASLTGPERRRLEVITAQLEDCMEYQVRLRDLKDRQIEFDLDDGVVVNYAKFGDVLAKIK